MNNIDFKELLVKENNKFTYLYSQFLNGYRIINNNVLYVFDEVGCGKTTSAIITIASVIYDNMKKGKCNNNILVITPKTIIQQFYDEVESKLNCRKCNCKIFNCSESIENIDYNNGNNIIIINHHKLERLNKIFNKWSLIIIDEAHSLICNSMAQIANYSDSSNHLTKQYEQMKNKINSENDPIKKNNIIGMINEIELKIQNKEIESSWMKFAKSYITGTFINMFGSYGISYSPEYNRIANNFYYRLISELKSEKIVFLSATPYKHNKVYDFYNYTLIATKIIDSNNYEYNSCYYPNVEWLKDIYSNNISNKSIENMENSNTSFCFKEITNAIKINEINEVKGKKRYVEKWEEDITNTSLKIKVENILSNSQENMKNRILIFVSTSEEGRTIFNRIFPNSNIDICVNNYYYDSKRNISCQFVMNKFANTSLLRKYTYDNQNYDSETPNILIVTHQVAQVGVNLPTFNYVINYSISDSFSSLEQRFGRIDRLNSKYEELHNIYYLDNCYNTNIYKSNLICALNEYRNELLSKNGDSTFPLKNLLLGKDICFNKYVDSEIIKKLQYWCSQAEIISEDTNKKLLNIGINFDELKNIHFDSFVYDEIDSEIINEYYIQESKEKKETIIRNNISRCIEEIEKIEELNAKIDNINNSAKEISEAGSIIYINNLNKIIVKCTDIVNSFHKFILSKKII